jgi:hypothetical protein
MPWLRTLMPQLTEEGIHLVHTEEMNAEQERFLEEYFHHTLYPIVTAQVAAAVASTYSSSVRPIFSLDSLACRPSWIRLAAILLQRG